MANANYHIKPVLLVVTSNGIKGETGEPTGFWLSELTHALAKLEDARIEAVFASIKGGEPPVDGLDLNDAINARYWNNSDFRAAMRNTHRLGDVNPSRYSAIFFAGGHGTMWDFPDSADVQKVTRQIYEAGGIVSAVCHGPAALVNVTLSDGSFLVAGKRVAAFTNQEEEEVQATKIVPFLLASTLSARGAIHQPAPNWAANVVADGRLVTGQNPASASGVGEALCRLLTGTGEEAAENKGQPHSALTMEDVRAISPALENYTVNAIMNGLWKRPDLSPRDRSIITVSALIARAQTIGMLHYFNVALESGVKPSEVSEIVTHLAFYAGWSNAFFAVPILKDVFAERGIGPDQLPEASPALLPLDEAAEERRAASVQQNAGPASPGLVQYTTDLLFRDLWLRPGLAPRDRSLVTVSALIASGSVAQITFHLNKAMDNGLTKAQASELLTHIAFYAGWPNAFSAVPVVKEILASRPG
jgi:putative intracellular protease/amidase/alkylhydroperoxidase/carboxymuconolactone decarboxylase family protein YurZ